MIFIFYFAGGFLEGFERCSDVNTRGGDEDENYRKFSSSPTMLPHVDGPGVVREGSNLFCARSRRTSTSTHLNTQPQKTIPELKTKTKNSAHTRHTIM